MLQLSYREKTSVAQTTQHYNKNLQFHIHLTYKNIIMTKTQSKHSSFRHMTTRIRHVYKNVFEAL